MPSAAHALIRCLKRTFRASELPTPEAVIDAMARGLDEFKQSPLYAPHCCELIISGFVGDEPMLFPIYADHRGELQIGSEAEHFAIGEGGVIATAILNHREYHDE